MEASLFVVGCPVFFTAVFFVVFLDWVFKEWLLRSILGHLGIVLVYAKQSHPWFKFENPQLPEAEMVLKGCIVSLCLCMGTFVHVWTREGLTFLYSISMSWSILQRLCC